MKLTELRSNNSVRLSIVLIILLVLLIALNIIGLTVYHFSHPEEDASTQIWNYLSSNLFELISISLLLPIIVLVIESHFNFIQSLLENRLKSEEAIRAEKRALVQKQRQERTEKRWETVVSTEKMMNQLFNLAIQVRLFEADDVNKTPPGDTKPLKDSSLDIKDLRKTVSEFSVISNNTINMWTFRLDLPPDDEGLFLYFLNILLNCTSDIALYIHETKDKGEIAELQAALGIIISEIKRITHHPIISILKKRVEIFEIKEDDILDNSKLEKIEAVIDRLRKGLLFYRRLLKFVEDSHPDYLPEISGDKVNKLYEALAGAREFLQESQENRIYHFEGKQELEELFYKIPRKSRYFALNRGYSTETIKHIADVLGYQCVLNNLVEKAK